MPDTAATPVQESSLVWNLGWLTPTRCRLILVLVLALGFLSHLHYLHNDCPIDLSGDEAQYWDWSRNLDLSYYSKGPLVAYVIRASCAIFGDTMPAVRYPALVLAALTSIVTYLLAHKLFGSERLALGTVLLFHIVPLFIGGSVLMTIDPLLFLFWGLATYFSAIAIFDRKQSMWVFAGAAIGIGFLAKYASFLWFVGLFGFLLVHHRQRKLAAAAMISLLIGCLFTIPVIVWNLERGWVSFRHVASQTGVGESGSFTLISPLLMIVTQVALLGPTLAFLVASSVVYSVAKRWSRDDAARTKLLLLIWIGLA